MGCKSCKSENFVDENGNPKVTNFNLTNNVVARVLLWVIASALTILIIPIAWIMLFNTLVLNRGTNIVTPLTKVGKFLKKTDDYDDDDYVSPEDVDPDDYELDNVEVIK